MLGRVCVMCMLDNTSPWQGLIRDTEVLGAPGSDPTSPEGSHSTRNARPLANR